ncbi:hypothetical protein [Sorangium sp. So ce131]|uniref:hypothetical protein n=1 Tax=Sorangium sp. So ce131 TaxID=3133282 RepID=UPI003F643C99
MSTAAKEMVKGVGALALVWLLGQASGAGTRSQAAKALNPLLVGRWSDAERRNAFEDGYAALERAKHIQCPRRGAIVLTESGRRAGLEVLGVEALPGRVTWNTIKSRYLTPRSLGLRAPKTKAEVARIGKKEGLIAAVLAHRLQLSVGDYPTLRQVRDRLAWRGLGVETREPFSIKAVSTLLVGRTLGISGSHAVDEVLALAVANAVGARRADTGEIQSALIWQWLYSTAAGRAGGGASAAATSREMGAEPGEKTQISSPVKGAASRHEEEDSSAFAARVVEVARGSETGRFGQNKVFISHVFRKLVQMGDVDGDAAAFKERLVAAHRQGLLSLSRADLVEAMDPKDTEASETRHLSATFHFVVV